MSISRHNSDRYTYRQTEDNSVFLKYINFCNKTPYVFAA